jgi:carbamoyl-phosphate synthase large subunit
VTFVINTTQGRKSIDDSRAIRRATLIQGITYTTTMEGARAAVHAMEATRLRPPGVKSIQEYHQK